MIAKALRLIRQYHELSRCEVAEILNISKEQLIAIESGSTPITKDTLIKYSTAFDIPVSSLVFFSDSLSPQKGKNSNKLRKLFAGKALSIFEWISNKDDSKIKA
ncbi:helix-turn-helix transcriptional regulator [Vibrio kasasachensis]|uniref:helix-turn-helix domain-containing protein n=1 Tax=Vibrio kasasachensis TaxID=2910248 RepID=UPI003D0A3651